MQTLKDRVYTFLRWTERYTKTDMVYLAKSGFWLNLGSTSVSLFSFVLYLAFARFLPKEVYGTYQYLLSIGAIVGAFTLTGMNTALTRAVARGDEGTVKASIPIQLKWGLIPLLGSWAFGGWYFLHSNYVIAFGLFLIGIFVPLNNTLNSYTAFLSGRKDFTRSFLYNFYSNLLFYPALIITAFFSKYALALLAANLLSQTIMLVILYYRSFAVYKPNDRVEQEALSYGTHLSAMGLLGAVASQIDSVLAFHFLGAAPLAIYSFATAIPERLSNFFKFIPSAALPKFAERGEDHDWRHLIPKVGLAMIAAAGIATIYALLAHPFFAVFFPAYLPAAPYSQVYGLVVVSSVGTVFATALTAQRRLKALYVFNVVVPVMQLVLQFFGVVFFGLWGLIAARLLYWTFYSIIGLFFLLFSTPAPEPIS